MNDLMKELTLRKAGAIDAKFIFEMMSDKEYQKHYLERLLFKSEEEAKNDIEKSKRDSTKGVRYYFIVLKGKEKIGVLDIYKINKHDSRASIGYGIETKHWGKGYGTQICKLGLDFMKNKLKLRSAEATADPENLPSSKVLEKNGFIKLGIVKDYYYDRGKFIDRALYWKVL